MNTRRHPMPTLAAIDQAELALRLYIRALWQDYRKPHARTTKRNFRLLIHQKIRAVRSLDHLGAQLIHPATTLADPATLNLNPQNP